MTIPSEALELASWRRAVAELYAQVRASAEPAAAHERWRLRRDELFTTHPQSPLEGTDPLRRSGLPYWPYDPSLRLTAPLMPPEKPDECRIETSGDGVITMRLIGSVTLPDPIERTVDVWWLHQYAGGVFLPLRDATAGRESYGAGRYLLDTAKGADLGATHGSLTLDLNFLYHPSCRYNPRWECPLAPAGDTIDVRVEAGERL